MFRVVSIIAFCSCSLQVRNICERHSVSKHNDSRTRRCHSTGTHRSSIGCHGRCKQPPQLLEGRASLEGSGSRHSTPSFSSGTLDGMFQPLLIYPTLHAYVLQDMVPASTAHQLPTAALPDFSTLPAGERRDTPSLYNAKEHAVSA